MVSRAKRGRIENRRIWIRVRSIPRAPSLGWSGDRGGDPSPHLGGELPPESAGLGHEGVRVGVLAVEAVAEIGVVGVAHPVVGIVPRPPMGGDGERDLLGSRR